MPKWMTASEAGRYLGVSSNTIRLWRRLGKISAKQVGKTWLVDVESIQDLDSVRNFYGELQSICNKIRGLSRHPVLMRNEAAQNYVKAVARLLYNGVSYLLDTPLVTEMDRDKVMRVLKEVEGWLG